ncbi:MAG: hypothetical protein ABI759_17840 [Candidatus Solibacter sp.]
MPSRRQWLQSATLWQAALALRAAGKPFWDSKDPAAWTSEEKDQLLFDSPWAQQGVARMETKRKRTTPGYGSNGKVSTGMPDTRPGVPTGGVKSVPIGEEVPPVPKPDGPPVDFPVLARWESARPVRLAGGPEIPEAPGQFYVIRLRGLPLMPPRKLEPGEPEINSNEGLLQAIKANSSLLRKEKPPIPCARLFTGSGTNATEVLLFFERGRNAITATDKQVTLESSFAAFHVSIRFSPKEMLYRGELAL